MSAIETFTLSNAWINIPTNPINVIITRIEHQNGTFKQHRFYIDFINEDLPDEIFSVLIIFRRKSRFDQNKCEEENVSI